MPKTSQKAFLRFRSARRVFLAIAATLVALAHIPATLLAAEEEKFRLGFGGALLGNLATYGLSNYYGLEYAVSKANMEGGVKGRLVEIVAEDDSCNPSQAKAAASRLKKSGVKFVMGHTCSGATRAALGVYGDDVLVISSSATDNALTDNGQNKYFFRSTPRGDAQTRLQMALIKKNGYKKIAILHDKGDYGRSLAISLKNAIEAERETDLETVVFDGITTGQVSFEAAISRIKDARADALLWGGYYNDAARLVSQLRQKDFPIDVIGADGLCDRRFLNIAQKAAEGVYCLGRTDERTSEAAREAVADHYRRYYSRDIGAYFFYAIGAAQALFAAIEKAGFEADFDVIRTHLLEDVAETAMGPVRFDVKGDVIGQDYKLYRVENRQFVDVLITVPRH
jgi:branched-chain amino acid transport system substrate-binding protein